MFIVFVDYDSGNLYLVYKVIECMVVEINVGEVIVILFVDDVVCVDWIVLFGDGVFLVCCKVLYDFDGLVDVIVDVVENCVVLFMGICVGMQMLVSIGEEYQEMFGFGWIFGCIQKIQFFDSMLKILYMGWNDLIIDNLYLVFEGLSIGDYVYFVYSYVMIVDNVDQFIVYVDYVGDVMVIVGWDNIIGIQFYFEKSQVIGFWLIVNFLNWWF